MSDEDQMALIRAFLETAKKASFVEASQVLGVTSSTMSRRVRRLERMLGVQLLHRTTRRVSLTEAGAFYAARASSAVAQLEQAQAVLSEVGSRPSGRLTISAPATFGRAKLAPLIPGFMRLHPAVRVDIQFTDRFTDLLEDKIDVAIRIGTLPDSSLVARKLFVNKRRLVAAPSYLDRYGVPLEPEELVQHRCLHFSRLASGSNWLLRRDGEIRRVPIDPWLAMNDASALLEAARNGAGISLLADFLTADDLSDGRLRVVLSDYEVTDTSVHIVYPGGAYVPAKTRAFIDYIAERLEPPAMPDAALVE